MAAEGQADWAHKQATIDRLIDAVDEGDAESKDRWARVLLDGYDQHGWHRRRIVESGGLLLHAVLNPVWANLDLQELADWLDEDRLAQVETGAPLTDDEATSWRKRVTERAFDPELLFRGYGNACVILQLRHSDGRLAHLAAMNWAHPSDVRQARRPGSERREAASCSSR